MRWHNVILQALLQGEITEFSPTRVTRLPEASEVKDHVLLVTAAAAYTLHVSDAPWLATTILADADADTGRWLSSESKKKPKRKEE